MDADDSHGGIFKAYKKLSPEEQENFMEQVRTLIHESPNTWLSTIFEDRTNRSLLGYTKAVQAELEKARFQIQEIQQKTQDDEIKPRIEDLEELIRSIQGKSDQLTARVLIPPKEMLDVHLVPTHTIDRLTEYNGDQNVVSLVMGISLGAIAGIVVNWVSSDPVNITKSSLVLIVVLLIVTGVFIYFFLTLRQRLQRTQEQIFHRTATPDDASNNNDIAQ